MLQGRGKCIGTSSERNIRRKFICKESHRLELIGYKARLLILITESLKDDVSGEIILQLGVQAYRIQLSLPQDT